MSREEGRWLVSLQLWAGAIVRSLGVREEDIIDVVQGTFRIVVAEWVLFEPPAELPTRTARRRWIAHRLLGVAAKYRRSSGRDRPGEPHGSEQPSDRPPAELHQELLTVQELGQCFERSTRAERWRVWIAREVDDLSVAEIARQEGVAPARVLRLLEAARLDVARQVGREEAAAAAARCASRTAIPPNKAYGGRSRESQ